MYLFLQTVNLVTMAYPAAEHATVQMMRHVMLRMEHVQEEDVHMDLKERLVKVSEYFCLLLRA